MFNNCRITKLNINNSVCKYINLVDLKTKELTIKDSDLTESSLFNIELNKTIFDNVNFTKSEIEEMSLKGIDLSTCKINNIKISPKALKGVIIDQFQALDLIRLLEVEIKE